MAATFAKQFGGIFGGGGGGGGGVASLLADRTAITNGATSVVVVFGVAFAATPVVVGSIFSSSAGNIQLSILGSSVSTTGFTFDLSGAALDGTYTLHWIASAVND